MRSGRYKVKEYYIKFSSYGMSSSKPIQTKLITMANAVPE